MKLNRVEKAAMNSPFRRLFQQREANTMLALGGGVEGGRVLEIGCGQGIGVKIIFDTFRPSFVEAFDFDPDMVRRAGKRLSNGFSDRVKLYTGSATGIQAPDACFDAVFDFGVLHHVPDNDAAFGEIARVLKPNGKFYFMELLSAFTMHPVVRLLTKHPDEAQFTWEELSRKMAKHGLSVREDRFALKLTRVVGVAQKRL